MAKRITVDPITRIEGHLRIDVEVDNGKVIEKILVGRDPREAWSYTQRFCGVCTTVHAITSVRAVENALQMEIPVNAQLIRNIIQTAHAIQDHIVHFYHLSAVDWVDVTSALKADPVTTAKLAESLSDWPLNGPHEMKAVQERPSSSACSRCPMCRSGSRPSLAAASSVRSRAASGGTRP